MGAAYSYIAWLVGWATASDPPAEERGFSLNSKPYSPAVYELPYALSAPSQYYTLNEERRLYIANHHWVLLAGIVADLTLRLSPQEKRKAKNYGLSASDLERPCYLACDRTGTIFPIVFRLSDEDLRVFKQRVKNGCREGNTIAIFYAGWVPFQTGLAGVVVGRLASIKVLPCPLGALLHADTRPSIAENACPDCGFNVSTDVSCDKCRALSRYCTKKCRATYSPPHKKMCTASKQVKAWKALDWEKFEEAWSTEV